MSINWSDEVRRLEWVVFGTLNGWTLHEHDGDKSATFLVGPLNEPVQISRHMYLAMTAYHAECERAWENCLYTAINGYGSGMAG